MWSRDRSSALREDPAVAAVERILAAAASAEVAVNDLSKDRVIASHALGICACITIDDAPTWLIYDTPSGGLVWQRVADGGEPLELVDARRSAGGHADPAEVLRWLTGTASDPWSGGGDGNGDASVLEKLRLKVCHRD